MKTHPVWRGVRMRSVLAGADPDAPARAVTLPTSWDDAAAAALASLAPGSRPAALAQAAEAWIGPLARRAGGAEVANPLSERLHTLLLLRRGTADAGVWQGRSEDAPAFVFNLAAFCDPGSGFDATVFAEAVATAFTGLALAAPGASTISVRIADLAGLLAALGIGYDTEAARDTGTRIAAMLREGAQAASASLAARLGTRMPNFAAVVGPAGPAEALLGAETAGIAPAFSPTRAGIGLTRTARAWLAAMSLSAEAALVALLNGENPLAPPGPASHLAMHDAVAPFLDEMPPRPFIPSNPPLMQSSRPRRRELPSRGQGFLKISASRSKRDLSRNWTPLLPLDLPVASAPGQPRRGLDS